MLSSNRCPHSQHNIWRTLGRYKLWLQICNIYSVRRPICHVQGLFHFVYSTVWPTVKLHLKRSARSCPKFYNLPKLNASARNCGTHWISKIYSLEVLFLTLMYFCHEIWPAPQLNTLIILQVGTIPNVLSILSHLSHTTLQDSDYY